MYSIQICAWPRINIMAGFFLLDHAVATKLGVYSVCILDKAGRGNECKSALAAGVQSVSRLEASSSGNALANCTNRITNRELVLLSVSFNLQWPMALSLKPQPNPNVFV